MSKPITISIPHKLGRAEAQRRIAEGLANMVAQLGAQAKDAIQSSWVGDRVDFAAQAMGQAIKGHAVVHEERVDLEIMLPAVLSMMAGMVKGRVQKEGQLLLEKKG